MSDQLLDGLDWDSPWNESEHERTGGPAPAPILYHPDTIGVPLQEQVEQVEHALSKAIDVIEALVTREQELANDVYQAQVDAQDWQNKYNSVVGERNAAWKELGNRPCDAEQIRELTNEIQQWKDSCLMEGEMGTEIIGELKARVQELTDVNTQLELRNETQYRRLVYARNVLQGDKDNYLS